MTRKPAAAPVDVDGLVADVFGLRPVAASARMRDAATTECARRGVGLAPDQWETYRVPLETPDALHAWVADVLHVRIPRTPCPCHGASPFDAFAAAYFATAPVVVWHASRTLAGKSVLLATLATTEAITLGAWSTLLGGSGEQARRVLGYLQGTDNRMAGRLWDAPPAPRELLRREVTRETELRNGGRITALLASSRSARGPHPQRLRLDEVDEMPLWLYKAASAQPLGLEDRVTGDYLRAQTVASSTWQNPDGTMTWLLTEAEQRGWPIFRWCYQATLRPRGWLTAEQLAEQRGAVPAAVFAIEHDLGEPSPESRAIDPAAVARCFDRARGEAEGAEGEMLVFEEPEPGGIYGTGADWAKSTDWTIIVTVRMDRDPPEVVAFERLGRRPWPIMIARYNDRVRLYRGKAAHDATGVGKVVDDYLEVASEAVDFAARKVVSDMLSGYVGAIEHDELRWPAVTWAHAEHRLASLAQLFGTDHLPDTIAAGALALRAGKVALGADVKAAAAARRRALQKLRGRRRRS